MNAPTLENQPLAGIKVIELSTVVTASFASMMLAEQGADVIKVEPLGIGDPLRYLGTSKANVSGLFINCNRGKRSLTLDLKSPEGVEIISKLASQADVLVNNYRPGVMDKLGLGSEKLRAANPGLVFASISGFGTDGPMAKAPAYDPIIQAISGITALQGDKDSYSFMKKFVCDQITSYTACQAITAALLQRATTGKGQHIDISMLESALYYLWPDGMMDHTLMDEDVDKKPNLSDVFQTYPTADGYIAMSAFTDDHWQGLFKGTGRTDLQEDERFQTVSGRSTHLGELLAKSRDMFQTMSTEASLELLSQLDVPCSECLSIDKAINHPQVQAIGAVQELEHPVAGQLRAPSHPSRFHGMSNSVKKPLVSAGEHSAEILGELGYTEASIEQLANDKVIGLAT